LNCRSVIILSQVIDTRVLFSVCVFVCLSRDSGRGALSINKQINVQMKRITTKHASKPYTFYQIVK